MNIWHKGYYLNTGFSIRDGLELCHHTFPKFNALYAIERHKVLGDRTYYLGRKTSGNTPVFYVLASGPTGSATSTLAPATSIVGLYKLKESAQAKTRIDAIVKAYTSQMSEWEVTYRLRAALREQEDRIRREQAEQTQPAHITYANHPLFGRF